MLVRTSGALLLLVPALCLGQSQLTILHTDAPGVTVIAPGGGCKSSEPVVHHDGSWENAIAFRGDAVFEPYYGAFGEAFDLGSGQIECASFWITQDGTNTGQSSDLYVWDQGIDGPPTLVGALVSGIVFTDIPVFPAFGRYDIAIPTAVTGPFTVGSWGAWPGERNGYYWASDENGAGHPWTYAAAIGPNGTEGWQDPSEPFPFTITSMGIGVHFTPDNPTPTRTTSWSRVKALWRGEP
ncbi:MAG: hypothetical protein IPK72_10300 [Candidatus Eisenbacteria bacterium]|nr:hypothetical protein [Candidatus Eisenbacteria bacterium]